jgi:hypothetical protein
MANVKGSGSASGLETTKPLRRDFWKPEEWDGTPNMDFLKGKTIEEYEAAHPLLYPPKK